MNEWMKDWRIDAEGEDANGVRIRLLSLISAHDAGDAWLMFSARYRGYRWLDIHVTEVKSDDR